MPGIGLGWLLYIGNHVSSAVKLLRVKLRRNREEEGWGTTRNIFVLATSKF